MKQYLLRFFVYFILITSQCLHASPSISFTPSFEEQEIVNLIYKNGILSIYGMTGMGTISIYSIIGNEIRVFKNTNLTDFQEPIELESKAMYIVRIESKNNIKTYKLVAR